MELEEYLEKIKRVSEIEKLYEEVFGREEMGKFIFILRVEHRAN